MAVRRIGLQLENATRAFGHLLEARVRLVPSDEGKQVIRLGDAGIQQHVFTHDGERFL